MTKMNIEQGVAAIEKSIGKGLIGVEFVENSGETDPANDEWPFAVFAGCAEKNIQHVRGGSLIAMALDRTKLAGLIEQANELLGKTQTSTTLRSRVLEFHAAFGQPSLSVPQVPSEERVRLRARLITEEYFELMSALFGESDALIDAETTVKEAIENLVVEVDLVQLADAAADVAYVVEGTNQEFGINGDEVMAEVHRSNMAKLGGGKDAGGKMQKPAGWTPPRIDVVLLKQGWEP